MNSSKALWRDPQTVSCSHLGSVERDWLTCRHSLTRRLQQQFAGNVRFHLRREGLASIYAEEADLLSLDAQQLHWVREISWCFQRQYWIMARVVIPDQPDLQALRAAGRRSIGGLLFQSGDFVRSAIEIAEILPGHPYHVNALQQTSCWARRCTFARNGQSLLVSELFLPDFFAALEQ